MSEEGIHNCFCRAEYFSVEFQQDCSLIYNQVLRFVACTRVLRFLCARGVTPSRLRMRWLDAQGMQVVPDDSVYLELRIASGAKQVYHYMTIRRRVDGEDLVPADMLEWGLSSMEAYYELFERDGVQVAELDDGEKTYEYDPVHGDDLANTMGAYGYVDPVPFRLSPITLRCLKCYNFKNYRDFRVRDRRAQSCRACQGQREKMSLMRHPMVISDAVEISRHDISMTMNDSVSFPLTLPVKPSPHVQILALGRPKDTTRWCVVACDYEIVLQNRSSLAVEVAVWNMIETVDGEYLDLGQRALLPKDVQNNFARLSLFPGIARTILDKQALATMKQKNNQFSTVPMEALLGTTSTEPSEVVRVHIYARTLGGQREPDLKIVGHCIMTQTVYYY